MPWSANRRAFLASTSLTLTGSTAGCLESVSGLFDEDTPDRLIAEWPRNDVPPYEIVPSEDNDDYLGENMPSEPSLAFERISPLGGALQEPSWEVNTRSYRVERIRNEGEFSSVFDPAACSDAFLDRIEAVDFEDSLLVFVMEYSREPPSKHRWKRVEETEDGVHLFGYPAPPTGDALLSSTSSTLLEVELPDGYVTRADVSFTLSEDTRIHFDSTDGTVGFVLLGIGKDVDEEVTMDLQLLTADGDERVDGEITLTPSDNWKHVGLVGVVGETFDVEVTIDRLGIDATQEYWATVDGVEIRLQNDEILIV